MKLHRCPVLFAKSSSHPCWKVQTALDEAGIDYEVVKQPIRRSKRTDFIQRSGQRLAICATVLALVAGAAPAQGAGGTPEIERGSFVDVFADDFIFDLCGIETTTTLTQRFEVKTFPDGSQQVHVTRTYLSDDRRLPIEKGAGTTFIDANGVRTVTGTPIHLIGPRGGTRLIDAGRVTFGNEIDVRGPHPSLSVPDLAPYYCPA